MDAKPLVATSRTRFRGAAASPPEKTFSWGHGKIEAPWRRLKPDVTSASSSEAAARTTTREAREERRARAGVARRRDGAATPPSAIEHDIRHVGFARRRVAWPEGVWWGSPGEYNFRVFYMR